MVGRFLDNKVFTKEAKDFIDREHGVQLWWVVSAFMVAFALIVASLAATDNIFSIIAVIFFVLVSLSSVISALIIRDRNLVGAAELQSAIFSGAVKLSTDFCMIVRYDGVIIYIDPAYNKKLLGDNTEKYPDVSILHKNGFITKAEKTRLLSSLAKGKIDNFDIKLPDNIGEVKPVAFSLQPINISKSDIAERKVTLSVKPMGRPSGYFLLKTEKTSDKFDISSEMELSVGTYFFTKNDDFGVSKILEESLGYEEDELVSLNTKFTDLFYDEEEAKNLLTAKKDYQSVTALRNKNGSTNRVFITQKVVKENNIIEERRGMVIHFPDNRNDKGEKNKNIPDLVENTPIATLIMDTEGNIVRYNNAFSIMIEKANIKEEPNLLDIITGDGKDEVRKILKAIAASKEIDSKPLDIKIKGDSDTTASLYINGIFDKYGRLKGIISHLIDTTELKNLELRFVHSQKMQAVGQLAGGIAHDFNNLLTAMMGFCDLLLMRHPAGDQSFADIMQIKQNSNRAANLVRQLLAFSRKQTLQPKIINITDALADLSNLIGRLIGENIDLEMIHGRDIGKVKVDQGQLEQVIINLAVNARDAMAEGGKLNIKTSNIVIDDKHKLSRSLMPPAEDEIIENGEYVLIEVSDTGCGIPKEKVGKIFEPFYSTKEIGSGTGLGLSTVYGIVKQTDGYIYVSSKVGKGTKFSIFLPKHSEEEFKAQELDSSSANEKPGITDLTGKGTILLVEDETPVRIFSNSALTSKGYVVLEAENADVALKIVKDKGSEIDVIITDVVMPGMSGPDMIKQISQEYPKIKVIFISGYGEDAFVESFGEERKFNFLSKPYSLKQLAIKVKEVIEAKPN